MNVIQIMVLCSVHSGIDLKPETLVAASTCEAFVYLKCRGLIVESNPGWETTEKGIRLIQRLKETN